MFLDADERRGADDVADDDDDGQLHRLDLGPRDALDGARAGRKGGAPLALEAKVIILFGSGKGFTQKIALLSPVGCTMNM